MGFVHGHWRETGWVRGHFRHPLRPGPDQVVLVFLVATPVRIDLDRYGADVACCPLPEVTVPAPRAPSGAGAGERGPAPPATGPAARAGPAGQRA